jgi:hypothetical protein
MTADSPLLTVTEAAQYLRCSASHLNKLRVTSGMSTIADQFGAVFLIEHNRGGHIRAVFPVGSSSVSVIMPSTPSDWRCGRNTECLVKQKLRALMGVPA